MVRMSYIGHMNRHVIDLLDFPRRDSNLEPAGLRTLFWGLAA